METILSTIYRFYSDWLHPTFDSLITFLANNQYVIYILVATLVILSIVRKIISKKVKVQTLPKLIDFIVAMIVILLIIVVYNIFSPTISGWFKSTPSTDTSTPTNTTNGTESTPSQQSTPSYTEPKQLYYGGGCSGCYADGCPRNGYSYGGYDVNMYNYYRSLCQQCQCTSSRWQSLWR